MGRGLRKLFSLLALPMGLLQEVQQSTTTLDLTIFHCYDYATGVRVGHNWMHSTL